MEHKDSPTNSSSPMEFDKSKSRTAKSYLRRAALLRSRLRCLHPVQLQPFDTCRVEFAAVRREKSDDFTQTRRNQTPTITAPALRRTDVAGPVHVETCGVVAPLVILPGRRRESVAFGQPDEIGLQFVGFGVNHQTPQLASIDVAFAWIQDFHLTTLEGGQDLRGKFGTQGFSPSG